VDPTLSAPTLKEDTDVLAKLDSTLPATNATAWMLMSANQLLLVLQTALVPTLSGHTRAPAYLALPWWRECALMLMSVAMRLILAQATANVPTLLEHTPALATLAMLVLDATMLTSVPALP
jgi:hypothetical protein